MWSIFKSKKRGIEDPPKLENLNEHLLECPVCNEMIDFSECPPLTTERCIDCDAPFFVPYRIGDYWLFKVLGIGGMGCVYQALYEQEEESDIEYAIKLLPFEKRTDPYLVASLLEEARIGKSFGEHPNLARVFDFGESQGDYFCVMEYIRGETLHDKIHDDDEEDDDEEGGNIDVKRILKWGLQILSGEQRMVETGYLYRDLKPHNIIIDEDDNACLVDYGLCARLDHIAELNKMDDLLGSPHFMPPERILGEDEGMPGEIYSLGMILFFALARSTYYSPTEISSLVKKHVSSIRFASIKNRVGRPIPQAVANVIDKMVARDPLARYQSFVEVATDLKILYNKL